MRKIIVLSMCVFCAILFFVYHFTRIPQINVCIFSDIRECEEIKNFDFLDEEITEYETPNGDKFLRDLSYSHFFAAEYKSRELTFEIFAYEFETPDEAVKYFQKITGKKDNIPTNFSGMSSWGTYRLVVIDAQRAYCVYTTPGQAEVLTQNLKEIFSVNVL